MQDAHGQNKNYCFSELLGGEEPSLELGDFVFGGSAGTSALGNVIVWLTG